MHGYDFREGQGSAKLTLRGLVTYYVLFFIHLESRRVDVAGITVHPDERWMQQIARNVTMEGCGALRDCRYLLHDRDTKYTQSFRAIIASGWVEPLVLPARSPNLNAYAGRLILAAMTSAHAAPARSLSVATGRPTRCTKMWPKNPLLPIVPRLSPVSIF
jgi:hypothetical protein